MSSSLKSLRYTCQIIQKLQVSHILHQQINRGRTGSILTEAVDPSDKLYNNTKSTNVWLEKTLPDAVNLELNMTECGLEWECKGEYHDQVKVLVAFL